MGSDGGALIYDPEISNSAKYIPQGVAADLLASLFDISRSDLDSYSLQSQQRAGQAVAEGRFDDSLVPICDQNGLMLLAKDEHPRLDVTLEDLQLLPAAFAEKGARGFDRIALQQFPIIERVQHVHTAGSSSGIVDGAALALVGNQQAIDETGIQARARIRATSNVSVDPTLMLTGSVPAARLALERAGLQVSDIDLWECNESFAVVPLHFMRELNLNPEIVNVNGGAIAFGHPLGATGTILVNKLLDELERQDKHIGLVTLGVGGGMGVATIIERV